MRAGVLGLALAALAAGGAACASGSVIPQRLQMPLMSQGSQASQGSVDRCVTPAARYHGINELILRAILRVESGMKPGTITRNSNGTVDVGLGGINSIHFQELARYGVAPERLLDACVAVYVSAWQLKRAIATKGNTWEGIASYHSSTPQYNWRYRVLLHNELVRMGYVKGEIEPAPKLSSVKAKPSKAVKTLSTASSAATVTAVSGQWAQGDYFPDAGGPTMARVYPAQTK